MWCVMTRDMADILYNLNWCHTVNTIKQANAAITRAAKAGAYTICIESKSLSVLSDIGASLKQAGFDVESYNGSADILEISWG